MSSDKCDFETMWIEVGQHLAALTPDPIGFERDARAANRRHLDRGVELVGVQAIEIFVTLHDQQTRPTKPGLLSRLAALFGFTSAGGDA